MMIRKPTATVARAAFTLMEMLVVVAILVVLAGAAVPIYMSYLDSAKRDRARIDIKTLEGAVEAYAMDHGDYPQLWDPLVIPDPASLKRPPLTPEALVDPWGRQYVLDPQTRHSASGKPLIYSLGPGGNQSTMIPNFPPGR
jgi:general secretion pathway protein G